MLQYPLIHASRHIAGIYLQLKHALLLLFPIKGVNTLQHFHNNKNKSPQARMLLKRILQAFNTNRGFQILCVEARACVILLFKQPKQQQGIKTGIAFCWIGSCP